MIVDTSVLIAIVRLEPDFEAYVQLLAKTTEPLRVSAPTWVECGIVAQGFRDPVITRRLDTLARELNLQIEPFTPAQATLARQAYSDFGRGSGHPAQLNFGDCFSYALAKDLNEPLLFKGDDFAKTDVKVAQ